MSLKFIDQTAFHALEYVFDIAHDTEGKLGPVRLEFSREYVELAWCLDWKDTEAVKLRFDSEKELHLPEMKCVASSDVNETTVYGVGTPI